MAEHDNQIRTLKQLFEEPENYAKDDENDFNVDIVTETD